jgi:hypothetical protein
VAADDGDDASSYGTEESGEVPMETPYIEPAVSKEDDITTLIAAVAAFSREQTVVIEKLDFLEKIVETVQFDMINVRDDMKAVNVAMERIAGHVCGIRYVPAEVEIRKEQVSLDNSLGLPSNLKEITVSIGKGPNGSSVVVPQHGRQNDGRRGSLLCKLAKRTHDAHHVNLYSLENYRVSLICSVLNLTTPLFSL